MIWNSWQEFGAMGGYALYVWGSVLMVVLCIAGELLELASRRRAIQLALSLTQDLQDSPKRVAS